MLAPIRKQLSDANASDGDLANTIVTNCITVHSAYSRVSSNPMPCPRLSLSNGIERMFTVKVVCSFVSDRYHVLPPLDTRIPRAFSLWVIACVSQPVLGHYHRRLPHGKQAD